jgi:predicted nucleic acid-binding Zn ribbon protein
VYSCLTLFATEYLSIETQHKPDISWSKSIYTYFTFSNSGESTTDQLSQSAAKECAFCKTNIPADSILCDRCAENLNKRKQATQPQKFSNIQPVWHLILLSVLSFGFYNIYWFYRNWKQLKTHKNLDLSPGWRTLGLFVPLLGLLFIYEQFQDIKKFSEKAGVGMTFSPGSMLLAYMILNALRALPDPYGIAYLLSFMPLVAVQGILNIYWEIEQPGLARRTFFSAREIVLLVIGGLLFILVIIGLFIPE